MCRVKSPPRPYDRITLFHFHDAAEGDVQSGSWKGRRLTPQCKTYFALALERSSTGAQTDSLISGYAPTHGTRSHNLNLAGQVVEVIVTSEELGVCCSDGEASAISLGIDPSSGQPSPWD